MSSGPSFVFLHGFAGQPESWQRVVGRLPDGSRSLLPRLLGHAPAGQADEADEAAAESQTAPVAAGGGAFEAEVDRLARLIEARGFPPSHLVGYSLGGRLALGLLIRHPRLFSGATLLGTHPGLAGTEERRQRRERDEAWARKLEEEGLEPFLDAWEAQPLFSTQSPDLRHAQRRMRRPLDPRGLARSLRELGLGRMPHYRSELAGIAVPVCWAAGEGDEKFRALAEACASASPEGSSRIIPGAGHNAVLERPAAVAGLLQRSVNPHRVSFNALEGSLT